ncbi:MAG TPA: hypothetical protein VLA06_04665 [Woeseiaceae bacterium]|nr:hypothetical protein [Woeseiaceae bacterium]
MKKTLTLLVSGSLLLGFGSAIADQHEEGESSVGPATPLELWACKYNDGKGPADLDAVAAKWNAWADDQGFEDYGAWTLVPYYAGPDQDFDVLWLGGSASAQALGKAQDTWLAKGGKVMDAFNELWNCDAHANYAVLRYKQPPERENPANVVISFSDCNLSEGTAYDDFSASLSEWGKYREEHGSTSGMWVFMPAYGGGGEEFDFKVVAAWQNLEDQGTDYDQYSKEGWKKARELFTGKASCDSSRVYLATNRRMTSGDDD